MGGKTKQAQRTKNNARPSSSGRSAELLGSCAGEQAFRAAAALFPTLAAAAPPPELANDLALAIKKLNKKDPITKCKALQELTELVGNHTADDVERMLPNWTHYYRTLAMDPDRKVRELTQVCHGAIVSVCGRRIAPQLKALLPAWLQAQHDDFAPAHSRASASLHSTFPDGKLPEAISFCRAEILQHLTDNLLDANAAINKKLEDPEERIAATARVGCSALQGLRYLAESLPQQHDTWLWEGLQPLLAPPFWKRAHTTHPPLRAAWYGAAGALAARFGAQWSAQYGQKTLKVLLNARESGTAAQAQWHALLTIMESDPEWYERIEKKDLLLKRLLETLEAGGWGDARALCDLLPRVLRKLPDTVLNADTVGAIFNALFTGLGKRSVVTSPRERQAWLAAVAAVANHVARTKQMASETAAQGVRLWLQTALGANNEALVRDSAHCLAELLKHWTTEQAGAELLVRGVWQSLASTARAQVTQLAKADPVDRGQLLLTLNSHVLLLLTLRSQLLKEQPKERRGVKFSDDTTDDSPSKRDTDTATPEATPIPEATPVTAPTATPDPSARLHQHHLEDATQRVIASYLEFAQQKGEIPTVLKGLLPLLSTIRSKDIWAGLGRALGGTGPDAVWERALRPWLTGHETRCEALLDAVLLLVPHLHSAAQADVFNTIDKVGGEVSEGVVSRSASSAAPCVRAWLQGRGARAAALRVAQRAARGDQQAVTVLLDCVDGTRLSGPLAGPETVSAVLSYARSSLDSAPSQPAAALASRLLRACQGMAAEHYDGLVVALFNYDVHRNDQNEDEMEDSVRCSWRRALKDASLDRRGQIVQAALRLLVDYLSVPSSELNCSSIKHGAYLGALLSEFHPAAAPGVATALLPALQRVRARVLPHALAYDCIAGKLCCPMDDVEPIKSIASSPTGDLPSTDSVLQLSRQSLLGGALLRAWGARGQLDTALFTHCAELLYDCAMLKELKEGYAFWSGYNILETAHSELTSLTDDVISSTTEDIRRSVAAMLAQRASSDGQYWAYALAQYRGKLMAGSESEEGGHTEVERNLTGDGFFHTLQAESANSSSTELAYKTRYWVMVRCLVAAHGGNDPTLVQAAANADQPSADIVIDAYYRRNETMLYDTDISAALWSEAVCAASVCEYLTALVESGGWEAASHHWDFVNISLSSVLAAVDKSKHAWGSAKVAVVTRAVLRLYLAVEKFISSVTAESEQRQPSEHVAALPREWADLFQPEVTRCIYALVLHVLESTDKPSGAPISVCHAGVLQSVCEAVQRAPYSALQAATQLALPLDRLARAAAATLTSTAHHGYKYLAFYTLQAVTDPLVLQDAEKLRAWNARDATDEGPSTDTDTDTERPKMALDLMQPALATLASLLDAALPALRPGQHVCECVPHTDTHSLALGYLLLVVSLGGMASRQQGELSLHYMELIRSMQLAEPMLTAALRLLPAGLMEYAAEPACNAAPPKAYADWFHALQHFTLQEPSVSSDVGRVACRALVCAVMVAGGGAGRAWRAAAEPRAGRALTRVVATYVTPLVATHQLKQVSAWSSAGTVRDAEISIHWSALEVTCAVTVEELTVHLSIQLARDHPLTAPKITAPTHAQGAAPPTHWLAVYLAHQNGSVVSALKMWVGAVRARVEAAPQCYICYCRLHCTSARLPSLPCPQCRNKFHPECLRKWFSSSNKSNCPLCRASFLAPHPPHAHPPTPTPNAGR